MNSINNQNEITPIDKTIQLRSIFSPSILLFISYLKLNHLSSKLNIYLILITYCINKVASYAKNIDVSDFNKV